jgi:DNA recombination protein RmuC
MDSPLALSILVVLSALTLFAVVLILVFALRRREVTSTEVGAAISETWIRLGLAEVIGKIELQAQEIRKTHTTLEQMLRTPAGRASFGELSLEVILADQLPADSYGLRQKCFDGKVPDGHIRAPEGLICIDSKFPLDNFARMVACADGDGRKDRYKKQFLRDAEKHLQKVAEDYVQPERGTATFALVYIPSEAVYYAMATEGYELLKRYTSEGVQVVSPLLLSHKIELLKMGVRAIRLNESAQQVLGLLQSLASRFKAIEDIWNVFSTHLRNLEGKADELDTAYKRLRREFDKIADDTAGSAAEARKTEAPINPLEQTGPASRSFGA